MDRKIFKMLKSFHI